MGPQQPASPLYRLPARILPGYILREPLIHTASYIMYRARRRADGHPVVVKLATAERPSQRWLETLRREFDLSHALSLPHALQPIDWLEGKAGPGLVFEDAPGSPLSNLIVPLPLKEFFAIARALTTAVEALHEQHVAHCALRPEHCLWDAQAGRMDLTGFGNARMEDLGLSKLEQDFELEALPYLAPEQTGRMGYDVDGRADLYALGCIFYRLLTGAPPFSGADAAELVHAHLAKRPRFPGELNVDCPASLSKVVLKLLAKTPDERYQSATALLADLRRCEIDWQRLRAEPAWEPGARDRRRQFQLPQTLYGREKELARLALALREADQGQRQCVLLLGQPGVGKTALVTALQARHAQEARYLYGKFEKLRRDLPYGGVIAAFSGLVRHLLTETEERLDHWRQLLGRALGGQLRVIADVIPDLTLVVGDLPPLPAASPAEARQRFEIAFRGFIETLCAEDKPLVLFLDDLQWADPGSLRLITRLLEDSRPHRFVLIGAYRDNEVSAVHPLAEVLERLRSTMPDLHQLALRPLELAPLNRLLADTLHTTSDRTRPLAEWLHRRTDGNPFFARQLLATLKERGVVHFDPQTEQWSWSLEAAEALAPIPDVVHFIAGRIRELPARVQEWLQTAACLGTTVRPAVLSAVCGIEPEVLRADLELVRAAHLLTPLETEPAERDPLLGSWRFVHDRVQQAAYSLIPREERPRRHLELGRRLRKRLSAVEIERYVFELTNQFNHALDLLKQPRERREVARLNLLAGRRAKASAAFEAARGHFDVGLALLRRQRWRLDYELCFGLAIARVECDYVLGRYEEANRQFDDIIANSRDRLDQAEAYLIKIVLATSADDPEAALVAGSRCLALFDVDLPLSPESIGAAISVELEQVQNRLSQLSLTDLARRDRSGDAASHFEAQALMRIWTPAYQRSLDMLVLVTLKLVNSALKSGDPAFSAFAFMHYSLILGSFLGEHEKGAQFARLGLELAERTGDAGLLAKLLHVCAATVNHWTRPVAEGIQQLHRAHRLATEAADPLFAGMTVSFLFRSRIIGGERLDAVLEEWDQYQPVVERLRYRAVSLPFSLARQWVLALKGKTRSPDSLQDEHYDEEAVRQSLYQGAVKSPTHWYCVMKAMLAYYVGDFEAAWRWIGEADRFLEAAFGQLAVPEHLFFEALILSARAPQLAPQARAAALATIEARGRRLEQWARLCPENFAGRAALVKAELARLQERPQDAMEAYDEACRAARDAGALHVLALSHELAGRFYLATGFEAMARAHVAEAHYTYLRWGASAKAHQLAAALPHLVPGAPNSLLNGPEQPTTDNALDPADVVTITKAAGAIAGELNLNQLLGRLLRFVMEHAGASRAVLILQRGGELFVEGEADAEQDFVDIHQWTPLDDFGRCALSAVNFVRRTRRSLAVADAPRDQVYCSDPWIREQQPRSLLCMPIIRHGGLLGLLYLENGLTAHAFTLKRTTLLEVLVTQVATALENALLYDNLKREVRERERAEFTVQENERRWRSFLDNARLAVASLDLDGRIEYVNPYLLELTGYSRDELIGRSWFDTMVPARYQRRDLRQHFYELLRDRPHSNVRGALVTKRGQERLLSWSTAWLRDPDGQVVGTVSIGEDISDRLLAERELRRLTIELEKRVDQRTSELLAANAELESFAYAVSHDLRAPLRSIEGFSGAVMEDCGDQLPPAAVEHLTRVRRAAGRMQSIIEALLQMSRLTQGVLERERVSLSAMALEVGAEMRDRYPGREVRLHVEPRLIARADPRLLRIVLENLLDNAWKYTATREVGEVSLTRGHGRGSFVLADNGIGFDDRYADRLFVPFQRLHAEGPFEGMGIGLTTVQRIISRHGGEIFAESEPGVGSRFHFTLPAR